MSPMWSMFVMFKKLACLGLQQSSKNPTPLWTTTTTTTKHRCVKKWSTWKDPVPKRCRKRGEPSSSAIMARLDGSWCCRCRLVLIDDLFRWMFGSVSNTWLFVGYNWKNSSVMSSHYCEMFTQLWMVGMVIWKDTHPTPPQYKMVKWKWLKWWIFLENVNTQLLGELQRRHLHSIGR